MNKPLTNEQIWGLPEEQMPKPEPKDYFDLEDDDFEATEDTEITEDETHQNI